MRTEHAIGITIVILLMVDVWLTYQIYLGNRASSGVPDGNFG